ncbi:Endosome/lysosome-associated apoptosis and autophagy regulator family member 2 [Vulpes lagopus]
MRLLARGPARRGGGGGGRGRGRRAGAARAGLAPPWSAAWICCWALAGCRAAWAGDLPSPGRPLPPCLEVSRTCPPPGVRARGARPACGPPRRRLLPSRARGSASPGVELPAGRRPRGGVWLRGLSGDAFLFAPRSEGSEGLCGAPFRFQQGGGEEPGAPRWGNSETHLSQLLREPHVVTRGVRAPAPPRPRAGDSTPLPSPDPEGPTDPSSQSPALGARLPDEAPGTCSARVWYHLASAWRKVDMN